MNIRDAITAAVRVGTKAIAGGAVAVLAHIGVLVNDQAVEVALTGVVIGLVSLGLSALEVRFPIVSKILSIGLSGDTPSYDG